MVILALTATLTFALVQQPNAVVQQVYEISGPIERVDRVGRTITILSAGVVQAPIYAGPDLPIFDQLRRGDVVVIRYYDAYIVEVTPNARLAPLKDTTAEAQQEHDRDDAGVTQQLKLVVTIDAIDTAKGMVTYHGNDNRRVLRAVQQRQLIDHVKVGDVVTITYTRARAAAIHKAQ
jgi:hypothetical protein